MAIFDLNSTMEEISAHIKEGARNNLSDIRFLEKEIRDFKTSPQRLAMLTGERYYRGKQDILYRKRMIIGENGELVPVHNLPNARIVDNQFKKMVDQKNNYLLGQPIALRSDNTAYSKALTRLFGAKFHRIMKHIGEDSLLCGLGWIFPHYNEQGEFTLKKIPPYELLAGWADSEHTALDYAIRIYEVVEYQGQQEIIVEKVEVFHHGGIHFFRLSQQGTLTPEAPFHLPYFHCGDHAYHWERIPLIPFKYNSKELPLINMVKSLQDSMNLILSNFHNQMEEDPRNTIMVVVNYGGSDLAEFRHNLATFGAVHVYSDVSGTQGDVKTLHVEVNSENYKVILELLKKSLMENAMGYDAKDDRMSGNANQMNIQSMYCDIDLDANNTETEYQASLEQLLWFVHAHLYNTGQGDFSGETMDFIFNRDMLMNESDVIEDCGKSISMLSMKTIRANHPWVDDPEAEEERIKAEQTEAMEERNSYASAFSSPKQDTGTYGGE